MTQLEQLLDKETPELERMARRKDGVEFGAPLDRAFTSDEWLALLNGLPRTIFRDDGATVKIEMIDGVPVNRIVFGGTRSERLKRATLISYLSLKEQHPALTPQTPE